MYIYIYIYIYSNVFLCKQVMSCGMLLPCRDVCNSCKAGHRYHRSMWMMKDTYNVLTWVTCTICMPLSNSAAFSISPVTCRKTETAGKNTYTKQEYTHGSKPREESDLFFLRVSYPICKSLDMSTDFLMDRHTWSPHGKGRDGMPSYRRLAWRQVGSEASRKQECLLQWIHTRCSMVRRTLPSLQDRTHTTLMNIHTNILVHKCYTVELNACISTHLSSRYWRSRTCQVSFFWAAFTSTWLPAMATCLVHYNSVWCILSHRYQPRALPTMPSCLPKLHQNCPSATTKLGASLRACQPRQPVTITLNHEITCWEANEWGDSIQNEIPIMWLYIK